MPGTQSLMRRVPRGGPRIVKSKVDMIRHLHENSWPMVDKVFQTSGYSRGKGAKYDDESKRWTSDQRADHRHLKIFENYSARTEALATHEYALSRFNPAPHSEILKRLLGSLHHARMHYNLIKHPDVRNGGAGTMRNAYQTVIEFTNARFDYRVSWYLMDLMENTDRLTTNIPFTWRTLLFARATPPYGAHREPENCVHSMPHVVAAVDKLRLLREASENTNGADMLSIQAAAAQADAWGKKGSARANYEAAKAAGEIPNGPDGQPLSKTAVKRLNMNIKRAAVYEAHNKDESSDDIGAVPDPHTMHMAYMFQELGEPLGVQLPLNATFHEDCIATEYPSYLTQIALRALEEGSSTVGNEQLLSLSVALVNTCSMESLVPVLNALLENRRLAESTYFNEIQSLYTIALGRITEDNARWSHLFPGVIASGARHNFLSVRSMEGALVGMLARVRSCDQSARERMDITEALYEIEKRTLNSMDTPDHTYIGRRQSIGKPQSIDRRKELWLIALVHNASLIVAMHAQFRISDSRNRVEVILDRLLEGESDSLFVRYAGRREWEMITTSLGPALAMDSLSWLERISAAHFSINADEGARHTSKVPHEFVIKVVTGAFLRLGRALSHFALDDFDKSTDPVYSGLAEVLGDYRSTSIGQLKESVGYARDDVAEAWLPHLERMSHTPAFTAADSYVKTCKVYLATERPTLVDQLAVNGQGRAAQLIYERDGDSFSGQDETAAQAVGDKAMYMDDVDELSDSGGRVRGGADRRRQVVEGEEIHPVLFSFNERLKAPSEDPREAIRLVGELQSKCAPNEDTVTLLVKSFFRTSESSKIGTLNVEEGISFRRNQSPSSVTDAVRVEQLRDLCAVLMSVCRIYDVCPDAHTLTLLLDDMSRLRMDERAYVVELAEYFEVALEKRQEEWTPSRRRQGEARGVSLYHTDKVKTSNFVAGEEDGVKDIASGFLKEDGTYVSFKAPNA